MKKILLWIVLIFFLISAFLGFYIYYSNINRDTSPQQSNENLKVVTTTTMITDLLNILGKDVLEVDGLMGTGVDPHLYQATESDVRKLQNADIIFYNGLHLEGKMADLFEEMSRLNIPTYAVTDAVHASKLLSGEDEFEGSYDPHIWSDVQLWKEVVKFAKDKLVTLDPSNSEIYIQNASDYLEELNSLQEYISKKVMEIPKNQRILITAHDAFAYFGNAYDFNVLGLQGISTETEAGVLDVQNLAQFITENKVPAIFIETSVQTRHIEALQQAVLSRDFDVEIGGELFSDSMGNPDKPEGTYKGMIRHNVDTIVNALKK
ncbi:zinc ABC transporter substrate-binding protein [Herbivorax sp. ANBcel31]|uniref:metal ABC transporter solute-binding protein, Zn/Mn family n=1 Tax=Herbivorax sp. ANBcel31 TaxID=3069754 RepID=UPI0027B4CBC7|nr:zinc ABC transporter substrate-binding protein [Herbivorax sp. ANBcel31]MDQ2086577.1 zinc ABC transporter substrate-binding protein [Herbivorax sp. ANBcel31]